ncbi:hypothetical protein EHS13_07265 [Paenibacillus psychroresistens]|uniref:WD40 repeat domain-containing protein n=1 Tax=Paenibacillus psychroresistens TaxID=1778678 RepID=A0A6B8REU6_9BACL|nr:hypothetical protein [Paenibacillus psychroresistens]QGQ94700.1 hypothetical protein EHS13_07265 [Paenibacillus psychroresistens]
MSHSTFRLIVVFVLLSFLIAGCTNELKPKTVIIPDTEESSEPDGVNEEFAVNKIYTLADPGDGNGDILGWIDQKQVIGLYGNDQSRSFERVDYKYNSHQEIKAVKSSKQMAKLAPDGMHIAYFENKEITNQLKLLDLANSKEIVIQDNVVGPYLLNALTWSNNSQYVTNAVENEKVKDGSFIAYDILHNSSNQYQVPGWNFREMSFGVKISDDGKSAMIIKVADGQYKLIYGELKGSGFVSIFEQPINVDGTYDYINDNQIIFVSAGGALSIYDRRNTTITNLLEHINAFQLSKDRKYIAYSKDQEEIFVAKLQGNNIINEKSIYKGLIPFHMQWSPDNKKILLSGRKPYASEAAPVPAASREPAVAAPAQITTIDNLPFIIEFK